MHALDEKDNVMVYAAPWSQTRDRANQVRRTFQYKPREADSITLDTCTFNPRLPAART